MNTEQQYIQGFNNGYVLAKHKQKLLNTISQNLNPNNNYLEGLLEGKNQLEFEQGKEKLSEIEELRSQSKNYDKELDRE
jgi:hypothetical protein